MGLGFVGGLLLAVVRVFRLIARVRLGGSWRPSSWLGILLGTKVYVDFSEAQADAGTFDQKFDAVLKVRSACQAGDGKSLPLAMQFPALGRAKRFDSIRFDLMGWDGIPLGGMGGWVWIR